MEENSIRISDQLRVIADQLDSKEERSKEALGKRAKINSDLLNENEILKKELDIAQKECESLKEEALKAQEVASGLKEELEASKIALKELKDKELEREAKKAEMGKYRQQEEKRSYEPKKGFRIEKED